MKEATGELSMTVVTIIAIVAIMGIITILMPMIKTYINKTWENMSKTKFSIEKVEIIDGLYY